MNRLAYSPDALGAQAPVAVTPATPLPVGVMPGTANTAKVDRSIVASTTNQVAAPANPSRNYLLIENQDATNAIFVNLGAAATTTVVAGNGSKRIGPQGSFGFSNTNQAVNIIAAAGTPQVTVWEF